MGHLRQASHVTGNQTHLGRNSSRGNSRRVVKASPPCDGSQQEPDPKRQKSADPMASVLVLLQQLVGKNSPDKIPAGPPSSSPPFNRQGSWRDTMCAALKNHGTCTNAACTGNHGKFFGEASNPCRVPDCNFLFSPKGCQKWHGAPAVKVDVPEGWGVRQPRLYPKNGRAARN